MKYRNKSAKMLFGQHPAFLPKKLGVHSCTYVFTLNSLRVPVIMR